MDRLEEIWDRIKEFAKYTIESNFTCKWDFYFFLILALLMITSLMIFTAISYQYGWDAGETEGLKRGFENGKAFIQ